MRLATHGFEDVLAQFRDLAQDYRDAALADRHHGFSNVRETLGEIHKGASKAWPCGAGFGLLGVSTSGDVNLCHRFAGSDDHKLGTVRDGIDRDVQRAFLDVASRREQDRLPDLLGAAALRRRLLSRGAHALRHDRAAEPALLRLDSRLDRYVPADLRRDRAGQPGVSAPVRGAPMKHLSPVNAKARRLDARVGRAGVAARRLPARQRRDVVALRIAAAAAGAAHPARLLDGVRAGLGSRSHRRHRRAVPAGRARPVRLPPRLLLARAGARPAEPRAGLDQEVRRRPEGLAARSTSSSRETPPCTFTPSGVGAARRCRSPRSCSPSARRSIAGPQAPLRAGRAGRSARRHRHDLRQHLQGRISVIDEATEKLTREIPVSIGIPGRRHVLGRPVAALRAGRDVRESRDRRSRQAARRSARSR